MFCISCLQLWFYQIFTAYSSYKVYHHLLSSRDTVQIRLKILLLRIRRLKINVKDGVLSANFLRWLRDTFVPALFKVTEGWPLFPPPLLCVRSALRLLTLYLSRVVFKVFLSVYLNNNVADCTTVWSPCRKWREWQAPVLYQGVLSEILNTVCLIYCLFHLGGLCVSFWYAVKSISIYGLADNYTYTVISYRVFIFAWLVSLGV